MSWPREEHMPLLAKFGHMITIWNDTEHQWRSSLLRMENPETFETNATAEILSAHLGNMQLLQSAKTFATEMLEGETQACMLEAVHQLDIIREYRNYYVHGFSNVGWKPDMTPIGHLLTISARGRLTQHDRWVEEADIDLLIERLGLLRLAFGQIVQVHRKAINHVDQRPITLPELPDRLPRLEKEKRFLFEYRNATTTS